MARRVFFSFHYQRDVIRAAQVRNSWVTKPDREYAGFWDKARWEQVLRDGDDAVKRWINRQLSGTSVTVVLIGSQTYQRKYVNYEIERTWNLQHGLLGIYIHHIKNFQGLISPRGTNPFTNFCVDEESEGIPLSQYVATYDWIKDDGYANLGKWIEKAARDAGL
jgi:hypothetical protein